MDNKDLFRGLYPELDRALDIVPFDSIMALVFVRRTDESGKDELGIAFAMYHTTPSDREAFEKLIDLRLTDEFYRTPTGHVGILCADIMGLESDLVRIYKNQPHNKVHGDRFVENIGYYLDSNGNTVGKKIYTRDSNDMCYYIDYYDKDGNLVRKGEKEVLASYEDWKGPDEIYDIVVKNDLIHHFTKKMGKNQAYIIVNPHPVKVPQHLLDM